MAKSHIKQGCSIFSTDNGRRPPRPAGENPPCPIARSDLQADVLKCVEELRLRYPHECRAIFTLDEQGRNWDIRWFWDEYDFHFLGGRFCFEVICTLAKQNEDHLIEFVHAWSANNAKGYLHLESLTPDKLFNETDCSNNGLRFLARAHKYMLSAFRSAWELEYSSCVRQHQSRHQLYPVPHSTPNKSAHMRTVTTPLQSPSQATKVPYRAYDTMPRALHNREVLRSMPGKEYGMGVPNSHAPPATTMVLPTKQPAEGYLPFPTIPIATVNSSGEISYQPPAYTPQQNQLSNDGNIPTQLPIEQQVGKDFIGKDVYHVRQLFVKGFRDLPLEVLHQEFSKIVPRVRLDTRVAYNKTGVNLFAVFETIMDVRKMLSRSPIVIHGHRVILEVPNRYRTDLADYWSRKAGMPSENQSMHQMRSDPPQACEKGRQMSISNAQQSPQGLRGHFNRQRSNTNPRQETYIDPSLRYSAQDARSGIAPRLTFESPGTPKGPETKFNQSQNANNEQINAQAATSATSKQIHASQASRGVSEAAPIVNEKSKDFSSQKAAKNRKASLLVNNPPVKPSGSEGDFPKMDNSTHSIEATKLHKPTRAEVATKPNKSTDTEESTKPNKSASVDEATKLNQSSFPNESTNKKRSAAPAANVKTARLSSSNEEKNVKNSTIPNEGVKIEPASQNDHTNPSKSSEDKRVESKPLEDNLEVKAEASVELQAAQPPSSVSIKEQSGEESVKTVDTNSYPGVLVGRKTSISHQKSKSVSTSAPEVPKARPKKTKIEEHEKSKSTDSPVHVQEAVVEKDDKRHKPSSEHPTLDETCQEQVKKPSHDLEVLPPDSSLNTVEAENLISSPETLCSPDIGARQVAIVEGDEPVHALQPSSSTETLGSRKSSPEAYAKSNDSDHSASSHKSIQSWKKERDVVLKILADAPASVKSSLEAKINKAAEALADKERKLGEIDVKLSGGSKNSLKKKMRAKYRTISDQYNALQDDFHMLSGQTQNEIESARRELTEAAAENTSLENRSTRSPLYNLGAAQVWEVMETRDTSGNRGMGQSRGATTSATAIPLKLRLKPRSLRSLSEEGMTLQHRNPNEGNNNDLLSPTSRYRFKGAGEQTSPYEVPNLEENRSERALGLMKEPELLNPLGIQNLSEVMQQQHPQPSVESSGQSLMKENVSQQGQKKEPLSYAQIAASKSPSTPLQKASPKAAAKASPQMTTNKSPAKNPVEDKANDWSVVPGQEWGPKGLHKGG